MESKTKETKSKWGICQKNGWKVYFIYDTKEEAEAHLGNPKFYEVREIIE